MDIVYSIEVMPDFGFCIKSWIIPCLPTGRHNNSVEAVIVANPEDYLYSSARDYYSGLPGLIEIILVEPMAL